MHFKSITSVLTVGLLIAACGQPADKNTSDRSGGSDFKTAANPPIHGAIFTTDESGDQVNGNIYTDKEDVYLNGGPRKPGAAGLPDGDYYYIVVSPGCKDELAGPTAPAPYNTLNKIITVEDGEFTDLMQLAPFADTPNPGGEYQVRVTPVDQYDDEDGKGCFGFLPQYSKMDNFKVRPKNEEHDTFCISGYKWYDVDQNGEVDSQENPIGGPVIGGDGGPVAGITITLMGEGVTETTETASNGQFSFCGLEPGDYIVGEILPEGWVNTEPNEGEFEVTITDHDVTGLGFGNVCYIDDVLQGSPEDCPISQEDL